MNKENLLTKEKLKTFGYGAIFLAVIGISFYYTTFRTTNEIGFLGPDKTGRQIFIQSLDAYFQPDIRFDSDFNDHNILSRIIQEPMRTTLKIDNKKPGVDSYLATADTFLSQPAEKLIGQFKTVSTREDSEVSVADFKKRMEEKGVKTIEDLLAGYGFKRLELLENGNSKVVIELKGNKNVYWAGGE